MGKKKKTRVELRYYEVPQDQPVLALLGDSWKRNYGNDIDCLHFHNLLEVGYCYYGEGVMDINDGTTYPYQAGTFTVIPRNLPHTTTSAGTERIDYWEYVFLDDDHFLKQIYASDQRFLYHFMTRINQKAHVLHESEHPDMADAIQGMFREMRRPQEFTGEIVRGLLLQFIMQVARLNPAETIDTDSLLKAKTQISPALDYLQEHYAEPIRVRTLAAVCGISETHFRRLFGDAIHITPVEYINLVRIQKACERMRNTGDSMDRIASKTGFLTQSSFNRTFLKIVGTQPFKWKQQANSSYVNTVNYKISAYEGWL